MTARWPYILAAVLVVPLGLGVRAVHLPFGIGGPAGDALWAVELYCVLRALRPRAAPRTTAVVCYVIAVLDEASQAIHVPWLDAIRATWIGHMLLGRGFVWLDMVWYALGTALAWAIDEAIARRRSARAAASAAPSTSPPAPAPR